MGFSQCLIEIRKAGLGNHLISSTNHFWTNARLVKVLGSRCVLANLAADATQRFNSTSRPLRRPSQFNLSSLTWARKSISGSQECHYLDTTSPSTRMKSSIWSPAPEPLPLAQGSPKLFLLRRKSSVHCLVCEKIKDVWLLLSRIVSLKGGRMLFTANFRVLIWNRCELLQRQYWAKSWEKCVHSDLERATFSGGQNTHMKKKHTEESIILKIKERIENICTIFFLNVNNIFKNKFKTKGNRKCIFMHAISIVRSNF